MGRSPCCDKANVKRGPWSPEEDATLRSHMELHGTGGNWISLPQKAGLKRCGKSCRLRWLNYLRPDIKHGRFTAEEDLVIVSLYRTLGSRWSLIASRLPGRTDNDVKNYWNTKLAKRVANKSATSPPPPEPQPLTAEMMPVLAVEDEAAGFSSWTELLGGLLNSGVEESLMGFSWDSEDACLCLQKLPYF